MAHTERLLKLADLLEADANNPNGIKFDLESWAMRLGRKSFPKSIRKLDCGTQACAIGLACLSGAFANDGLSWKPAPADEENNIYPVFKTHEGFYAVQRFFDISIKTAFWFFASNEYPQDQRRGKKGELAVAARIREFINDVG